MYDFTTLRPRRGMGAEKWSTFEAMDVDNPALVPYSVADMEFAAAPQITAAIQKAASFGVYGYTTADGPYRRAVCRWMARRHGWTVEPEWMFQTFGVVPAMNLAVHALIQPGEGVIIQPPVYPPFRRVVENTGRRVWENPLKLENGRYVMDLEGLEALAARPDVKLFFLCSPHNPVGRVWTRAELQAAADICARHGVTVFSDEIHADFVHPGHVHTPFAALDGPAAAGCIVGTSASKSFNLAGLATANIIVPDSGLRAALLDRQVGYTGEFTSYFGLAATRAAYEEAEDWLEELLAVIQGNYEYCKAFLIEKFPSVVTYPLEGTYLMWCDFRSLGLTPEAQEKFFLSCQLCLDEGYIFGSQGAGFERINLACPRPCLEAAMERLDKAAEGLPR
ncbi:MalY/PatB family protein [Pseudoflavonifractor capillosus]|uniref:cysteine-S-conjugate beta-lyase n=1 Tax=Pseudoflavonifractor capillosus TaxID=106588 RepID=A0A921SSH3_9FIRM|nr:MalY/PatB family protein [Pseudoflavonifractor capillosus]HJG86257.1 pyridoxal phosphate-dependent aminotransferase [Pseudoflavonifractor capillosus]